MIRKGSDLTDRRTISFAMAVPALLWVACWPFVDSPVNDDFSYAFTVERLLDTGDFTYNGWSSAMLGVQAYWGAAFAKLFGFSHNVLRLSTLSIAIACAALAFMLHRRCGIERVPSLFGTLLLAASPLFTAWSASFMTDIPGLLFALLIFHCVVGGMKQTATNSALPWAAGLFLTGIVGGTVRQTLLVLGFAGLLLLLARHRRRLFAKVELLSLCAGYVVVSAAMLHWLEQQPYSIPESAPSWKTLPHAALPLLALLLECSLYLLPLTFVLVRVSLPLRTRLIVLACVAAGVLLLSRSFPGTVPARLVHGLWIGDTITPTGMLYNGYDTPGYRPVVISEFVRRLIGIAVLSVLAGAAVILASNMRGIRAHLPKTRGHPWSDRRWTITGLLVVAVVYFALIIPRASLATIYDRYLIPVLPIATLVLMSSVNPAALRRAIGPLAWGLLIGYALIGVAFTSNHFAELRARDRVATQLLQDGVSRTELVNGLAYDGWTQVRAEGFINDPRIRVPPDAYVDDPGRASRAALYEFLSRCPAIDPDWIILNWPASRDTPEGGRCVMYRTVLPPFERWLVLWPLKSPATTGESQESSTQPAR